MNALIADILKQEIEDLPFVDRITGLIRALVYTEKNADGVTIRKVLPLACDVSADDCARGKYQDLVPNSDKRSVLYFEEIGGVEDIGRHGRNYQFRSRLRLVGWLNLKKMGITSCSWSGQAVLQILTRLHQGYENSGNILKAQITSITEVEKSAAGIFGKYTYDEAVNQYLLYPYDYFALNISVEFEVNPDCIEDFVPGEPLCDLETLAEG